MMEGKALDPKDSLFIAHPPKLFVIGASMPNWSHINDYLLYKGTDWNTLHGGSSASETIAEAAGRVCYQSWRNRKGSTRAEYLQRSIIEHGHGSVLEHIWFNILVADLPRSVQLELVRHGEGTAFSFESQRFTDDDVRFVVPPALRNDHRAYFEFYDLCLSARVTYTLLVEQLNEHFSDDELFDNDATLRRKRIKEAARSTLPNCVAGDGLVSMNARAARHIINLRSDEHADASIREFASELYDVLLPYLPAVFSDATKVPVAFGPDAIVFKAKKV